MVSYCKHCRIIQVQNDLGIILTLTAPTWHLNWRCCFLMSSVCQSTVPSPGQDLQSGLPFYDKAMWRVLNNPVMADISFFYFRHDVQWSAADKIQYEVKKTIQKVMQNNVTMLTDKNLVWLWVAVVVRWQKKLKFCL